MPMIPMTCTSPWIYAGKRLRPGDPFEVRGEADAKLAVAIGKARRGVTPVTTAPVYQTRVMVAATAPAPAAQFVITVAGRRTVLDGMGVDALHALARELGVNVHHKAGAYRVRAALVDSQKPAE